MKTTFDLTVQNELIERIGQLKPDDTPNWGTMNVYQMTAHMTIWNRWVLDKDNHISYRQTWLGKILGKFILKSFVGNDKPVGKNAPARSDFMTQEKTGDLEKEKNQLIELISAYKQFDNPKFIHDFFGKMSKEQIGILVYKHIDHHLRQFGK